MMTSKEIPEDTKEFKVLIKQRASIRGQLTNFINFLTNLKLTELDEVSESQIKELNLRTEKLETLFSDFSKCQDRIEVLCSSLDDQLKERELTENLFYSNLTDAQSLIFNHSSNVAKSQHNSENTNISSNHDNVNVKLPIIKLPSFNGNYFMWLEFRDIFESLIHKNEGIPDINKFHYLRSALEGSAALVIKSIEFTSNNYNIAWDLLCQRYNNKNILINNHLKALFKIEHLTRESHRSIRYLIDIITKNLRALTTLGLPVDHWDALIIYMVSTKLDTITSGKWEEHKNNSSDLPLLSEFIEFLRNRADILETMQANRSENTDHKRSFPNNPKENKPNHNFPNSLHKNTFSKSLVASTSMKHASILCPFCNQSHRIIDCDSFKALSPENKYKEVLNRNLCSNCLRRGHEAPDCRLGSCRICNKKHNTMLHDDKLNHNNYSTSSPVSLSVQSTGQVLLGTALVKIINPKNKTTYHARALLDAGSQSSFMTENLKHKLGMVSHKPIPLIISGINNVKVPITDRCDITIHSLTTSFHKNIKCLVVPQITGQLPNIFINVSELDFPNNINLADPYFNCPSDIDLLLGADIFFEILYPDKITLGTDRPVLQSTKLGWLVAGPLNLNSNKHEPKLHCHFTKEISENLTKFWKLEEIPSSKPSMTSEEEFCEEHFSQNTHRDENGRFCVSMPLKEKITSLGDSYKMAVKRFYNIEKRLDKNVKLKEQYTSFIKEYEELGHLSKIKMPYFGYYMPHHAVIKDNSETTKLRVVFDASAKTTSSKSLNDIQCIGPVVQDDLFNILIRFRQHRYVLSGDIQKMYRQVKINESQRKLQLILWRDDKSKPLDVLQLNTITYGTASAPYLSTRCLLQLALECPDPHISKILSHDLYMDDLLTGSDSEDNLAYIFSEVKRILNSACFPLHKFRTNCPQIFNDSTEINSLNLCEQSSILGLLWAPDTDAITFSVNLDIKVDKITKRIILSNSCKVFDPLGLLSACTITLKILLQKLWKLKLNWDEPVPNDIKKVWQKLTIELNTLLTVSVPRHVLCLYPATCQLHCFVDASQEAYAACVYMRTQNQSNHVTVKLLCAKTRVAPLKTITIPRLELCAALLGARLVAKVREALRCTIHNIFYWSDSTITLGWIKTKPKTLKTFVCNRVNEINDLTDRNAWRHVPTTLNPADMASRGVNPSQLCSSVLWWEGPPFLMYEESQWPVNDYTTANLPEIKVLLNQNTII